MAGNYWESTLPNLFESCDIASCIFLEQLETWKLYEMMGQHHPEHPGKDDQLMINHALGVTMIFLGFPTVFLWLSIPFQSSWEPKPHVSLVSKTCSKWRFDLRIQQENLKICKIPAIKRGNWTSLYKKTDSLIGENICNSWILHCRVGNHRKLVWIGAMDLWEVWGNRLVNTIVNTICPTRSWTFGEGSAHKFYLLKMFKRLYSDTFLLHMPSIMYPSAFWW